MALKPAEIIAGGGLVLTGLANMKANKKWIPWVLFIVGFGVLTAAFWPSADETKTVDNHQMNAVAAAPNATAINAAPGANVLLGASLEQIKQAMREVQKEKDPELRKIFPLGYILFTATEHQQIVPLNSPMDSMIEVDWRTKYTVSFEDNKVLLELPTITIHQLPGDNSKMVGCGIGFPKRIGAGTIIGLTYAPYVLCFAVVAIDGGNVTVAMGLQPKPESKPPLTP
jgi:hypothetical protein